MFEFFEGVTVSAGDGVGGFAEDAGDFQEGQVFPDFQDDDFLLVGWQMLQGRGDGVAQVDLPADVVSGDVYVGEARKEVDRLLAVEESQGFVAGDAEQVGPGMFRPGESLGVFHQLEKGGLEDVFGVVVVADDGPDVANDAGADLIVNRSQGAQSLRGEQTGLPTEKLVEFLTVVGIHHRQDVWEYVDLSTGVQKF